MAARQKGFSLIELILFIIIVGIALTAIIGTFTQGVKNSADPYIRQRAVTLATAYMDEILQKRWNENSPVGGDCVWTGSGNCAGTYATATYAAGDRVVPTAPNNHVYEASTAGTTSGTEPTWPTDGSTVSDGGVIWRDLGLRNATPIGAEGGETRQTYDDIDDYNALSAWAAPTDQQGNAMPYSGFEVKVEVTQPGANWNTIAAADVRQVTVSVRAGNENFSLTAYRLNF